MIEKAIKMQLEEIRAKAKLLVATSFARKYNLPPYAVRQFQKGKDIRGEHLAKIINGLKDMGE